MVKWSIRKQVYDEAEAFYREDPSSPRNMDLDKIVTPELRDKIVPEEDIKHVAPALQYYYIQGPHQWHFRHENNYIVATMKHEDEKMFEGALDDDLVKELLSSNDVWAWRVYLVGLKRNYLATKLMPFKVVMPFLKPKDTFKMSEKMLPKYEKTAEQILPSLAWAVTGKTKKEWDAYLKTAAKEQAKDNLRKELIIACSQADHIKSAYGDLAAEKCSKELWGIREYFVEKIAKLKL